MSKWDWSAFASSVTAIAAVAALGFTAQSLSATRDQITLAEQGQITDRYSKAISQVGAQGKDQLAVRLGGIYALERLGRDSARDQPTIVEVLSAFVRSAAPVPPAGPGACPEEPAALDVQAALAVLGRRNPAYDKPAGLDLSNSCLERAELSGGDFHGANLAGANLARAHLVSAKLSGANLAGADMAEANLTSANLAEADLAKANLTSANLADASLVEANLSFADLSAADLNHASLADANLTATNLILARLTGADLTMTRHGMTRTAGATVDDRTRGVWW